MKALKCILVLSFITGASWWGYGAYLEALCPKVTWGETTSLAVNGDKTLPFYELMSPVPDPKLNKMVPKLEYKKGPPDRYIEKMSLVIFNSSGYRERIVFHGRRTRDDLSGISLFPEGPQKEAKYIETALKLSQGKPTQLNLWQTYLLKPLLLKEALTWVSSATKVLVMEQAGVPAFFIQDSNDHGKDRSIALFMRRNSFYLVEYLSSRGYQALSPIDHFRKSFLAQKRSDALEYLAQNLAEVKLEQSEAAQLKHSGWPILLLAANVSLDPSSIDAYFHFAGISALLYKTFAATKGENELLDVLRNNVLASEFYAKDVAPNSTKTNQIGRLARMLTQAFGQGL